MFYFDSIASYCFVYMAFQAKDIILNEMKIPGKQEKLYLVL